MKSLWNEYGLCILKKIFWQSMDVENVDCPFSNILHLKMPEKEVPIKEKLN